MMFAAFIQSVAGSSRSFRKSFNATDSRSRGGSAAFHPSSIVHVWDPDSLVEVPAMDLPAGPRLRLVRRWLSPSSGASPSNLLSFFQEIGHRPGLGYLMVDMLHESLGSSNHRVALFSVWDQRAHWTCGSGEPHHIPEYEVKVSQS